MFHDITEGLEEAASNVKLTSDYSQDLAPDEPAEPVTDAERDSLVRDENTHPFADADTAQDDSYRNPNRGEYVPYRVKQARKAASMLPKSGLIKAQEDRLFEVARHDGQPKPLADAIKKARTACQAAYYALDEARSDIPTRAKSPQHKQAALDAIEAAKVAVDNAVRVSESDDIREQQYLAIVSGIAEAQAKAANALEVAAAEFARWRNLIAAGHDLAVARGDFGEGWWAHKDERSINPRGLVGDLRRARDLATTEDVFLSGRYLYDDPTPDGELPDSTREALANGTDFERTVLWRLDKRHKNDPSAHDSMAAKNLRPIRTAPIPVLHPDAQRHSQFDTPSIANDWD